MFKFGIFNYLITYANLSVLLNGLFNSYQIEIDVITEK